MTAITGVDSPYHEGTDIVVVSASAILRRGTYRHTLHPTA